MIQQSLSSAWAEYERLQLDPIVASQVQRVETRRAFYAGATSLMYQVLHGLSGGDETIPEDERFMESLWNELSEFAVKVERGIA